MKKMSILLCAVLLMMLAVFQSALADTLVAPELDASALAIDQDYAFQSLTDWSY